MIESASDIFDALCAKQQSKEKNLQFSIVSNRTLRVTLSPGETIFLKYGSMVAYEGRIGFTRKGQGIGKKLKSSLAGESMTTVQAKAEIDSILYLAEEGSKVLPLYLSEEDSVVVEKDRVLAFQPTVHWDVIAMKSVGSFLSSGMFSLKFKGPGFLAVLSNQEPLVLKVRPGVQIHTDPHKTILWTGNLKPELKTNIGFKSMIGYDSGEELQLKFEGEEGYVLTQPGSRTKPQ